MVSGYQRKLVITHHDIKRQRPTCSLDLYHCVGSPGRAMGRRKGCKPDPDRPENIFEDRW